MEPEGSQISGKLWKPHPDDEVDVREALACDSPLRMAPHRLPSSDFGGASPLESLHPTATLQMRLAAVPDTSRTFEPLSVARNPGATCSSGSVWRRTRDSNA